MAKGRQWHKRGWHTPFVMADVLFRATEKMSFLKAVSTDKHASLAGWTSQRAPRQLEPSIKLLSQPGQWALGEFLHPFSEALLPHRAVASYRVAEGSVSLIGCHTGWSVRRVGNFPAPPVGREAPALPCCTWFVMLQRPPPS